MKKIKILIASMLSAIVLVFAAVFGGNVKAANSTFYNANDAEAGEIASGENIASDDRLAMITYGSTSTVSTSYLTGDYTKSLHYDSGSNATHGIKFENKSKTTGLVIHVTMAAYDSGTSRKSNPIRFSKDGSLSNVVGTSSSSSTVTVDLNLSASTDSEIASGVLCCCDIKTDGSPTNSRRMAIYEVTYTYTAADDKEISFYDGDSKLTAIGYSMGATIDYVPTTNKTNYYFDGWYEDSNLDTPLDSTTVSSSTPATLYAKWKLYDTYLDSSNIGDADTITSDYYSNTIFNLKNIKIDNNSGKIMPNTGVACSKRINTNGTGSATNKVITFVSPYTCKLVIYTVGNTDRSIYVCEDEYDAENAKLSYTYPDNSSVCVISVDVVEGKTYFIGTSKSSTYIYGIYLGLNNSVNSSIGCQYDTEDSTQATAIRFIGTIKGLSVATDYSKLTDATFSFKVAGTPKSKSCSRVYKAVTAYEGYGVGTYNLYVVLSVTNVNNNIGKNITDLTLTLSFNDGTTKVITHDSFTLGYTTLVEA